MLEPHTSFTFAQATWVWLADHDLDGDGSSQISLYSGRGILSESKGPIWMIGTGDFVVVQDKIMSDNTFNPFSMLVSALHLLHSLN